jgi:hypothetical protein
VNPGRRWVGPGGCDARELAGAAFASGAVAAPLGTFVAAVMDQRWATSSGPEIAAVVIGVAWAVVFGLAVDAMRGVTAPLPRDGGASHVADLERSAAPALARSARDRSLRKGPS